MQVNEAAENCCFKEGHDFQGIPQGKPFVDPTTKAVLHPVYKILCRKCGMTPEGLARYGLVVKGKVKSDGSRAKGGSSPSPHPQD